jgi:hypothetical protein
MVADLMFKAEKAWHKGGRIYLLLSDRKELSFPVELNGKLKNATKEQLDEIELINGGTGLHWPQLDEDLSVMGILEGRFGTKST